MTSVGFPLKELRLHAFASPECPAAPEECCYELYAVSNHYGNLSGACMGTGLIGCFLAGGWGEPLAHCRRPVGCMWGRS